MFQTQNVRLFYWCLKLHSRTAALPTTLVNNPTQSHLGLGIWTWRSRVLLLLSPALGLPVQAGNEKTEKKFKKYFRGNFLRDGEKNLWENRIRGKFHLKVQKYDSLVYFETRTSGKDSWEHQDSILLKLLASIYSTLELKQVENGQITVSGQSLNSSVEKIEAELMLHRL